MTANKLQLNDNKTEAMIILSNRMSVHSPLPSVIHIGDADVPFVSSVKSLGVTLDSNLSMSQHISNTCKAAYIQIRHISSIRHLLTTQATQTLVCSLVLSRLDYCNSLLSGCPQYLLDKLQKVQNAAARLVCKAKKSDHIHPILETALATRNTSHSIQNFNYLLQLHLWNSPSVSVRSPSTLYSSKTITICIWHTNLCHPPCKHKNIWWKIFFLCWPICLEQFASNTPPLWFYLLF